MAKTAVCVQEGWDLLCQVRKSLTDISEMQRAAQVAVVSSQAAMSAATAVMEGSTVPHWSELGPPANLPQPPLTLRELLGDEHPYPLG